MKTKNLPVKSVCHHHGHRRNRVTAWLGSTALFATLAIVVPVCTLAQDAKTNFDDNVKSIFRQHCSSCHGADSPKGGLNVTNFTNLMQGGSSGSVIEAGDPDGSYLYNLITHEDEPVMPPDSKIPDNEVELVRQWIEQGALENQGSKPVMIKKPAAISMGDNPLIRPEVVANWPRMPLEPVQHTPRNPVALNIATSPWAAVAAIAGKNQVLLYNTQTLQLTGVLPFPEGTVNVVRFSRSGSVLLAAGGRSGNSGVAVLWDVSSGERIGTVGDELDAVLAADISPDHSMVALGGPGRVVNVYSTETGELKFAIKKHTEWITALAFSTDGVLLATGDRNGGLHVWESWTGREYLTLKGHSASINSIAWRADSNVVASASKDTTIRLWELNNGGQIKSWGAHGGGASSIAFTRDGRILSTGVDKTTKLWAQDGTQQKSFAAFAEIALSVAWCDETARAIAGDYHGDIRVWNSEDASQIGLLTANPVPLANHLAAAQAHLAECSARIEPLNTKVQQTTTQVATVKAELDAAVAAKTAARKLYDEMQTVMAETSAKANLVKAQQTETRQQLGEIAAAKPLLTQSLESMNQAFAKLPADESLKQLVTTLTQRLSALDAEINEKQTLVTTLSNSLSEITTEVQATDQKVQNATSNLKTTTDKVTELETRLAPLNDAVTAANAELKAAQNAQTAAQNEVNRCQEEVDFAAKLAGLKSRLAEAEQLASQHQQQMTVADAELKAAREKSETVKSSVAAAIQSIEEIQAEIRAARGIGQ